MISTRVPAPGIGTPGSLHLPTMRPSLSLDSSKRTRLAASAPSRRATSSVTVSKSTSGREGRGDGDRDPAEGGLFLCEARRAARAPRRSRARSRRSRRTPRSGARRSPGTACPTVRPAEIAPQRRPETKIGPTRRSASRLAGAVPRADRAAPRSSRSGPARRCARRERAASRCPAAPAFRPRSARSPAPPSPRSTPVAVPSSANRTVRGVWAPSRRAASLGDAPEEPVALAVADLGGERRNAAERSLRLGELAKRVLALLHRGHVANDRERLARTAHDDASFEVPPRLLVVDLGTVERVVDDLDAVSLERPPRGVEDGCGDVEREELADVPARRSGRAVRGDGRGC